MLQTLLVSTCQLRTIAEDISKSLPANDCHKIEGQLKQYEQYENVWLTFRVYLLTNFAW